MRLLLSRTLICTALAAAACSSEPEQASLADLDKEIAGDIDPALTSALEDQIIVDPALTQESNKLAIRPAPVPVQAFYPPPGGGRKRADEQPGARPPANNAAERQAAARLAVAEQGAVADCYSGLDYGAGWAQRLPASLPVYPGSRLTEAAGNDKGECSIRIATFRTSAAPRLVLDFYAERGKAAGYSVEHQLREGDHILGGVRASDGGAYYLIVTAATGGGSDVGLIANAGG